MSHGPSRQAGCLSWRTQLSTLEPAPREQACTADLGPRWLLVYTTGRDLTGVAVDAFGCRNVRLTGDPFLTPPGEASQWGLVEGLLVPPEDLLGLITKPA